MVFRFECVISGSFYIFSITRYTNIYSIKKIDKERLHRMEEEIRKLKISASKASCMDIFGTSDLPRFEFSRSDRDLIKGIAGRMKFFYNESPDLAALYFAVPKAFRMPQKGTVRLPSGLFYGKRKKENKRQAKTESQQRKSDNDSKRKHAKTDNKNSHVETKNDSSPNSSKHTTIALKLADTDAKPKGADINVIRLQIREQNSRLQKSYSRNIPQTSNMIFILGNKSTPISVVEISKDGDCLFGALAHQIFCLDVKSPAHHGKVAKLRADVVKHLNENMESFKFVLECRTENTGIDSHDFVNELLSQPGYWGDTESLKAISEMYKVNIIIFNECDTLFLPFGSNCDYKQTVCIAYRYDATKSSRNHYDSVYKIPDDLLERVVQYLASKNQEERIEID